MRIIVANIQSGIGITKGYRQYLTSGWRYFFPHGSRGVPHATAFLKAQTTDIAFLMEVDAGSRRTRYRSQLEAIVNDTGLSHARFFSTPRTRHMNEGSAIISRYPVLAERAHPLPSSVNQRVLGELMLDVDGETVTAFIAHLALGAKPRGIQLAYIAEIVRATPGPVLLGGDFNERDKGALRLLEDAGLTRISARGYPSWKPRHELQALFLSEHFYVAGASVPQVSFSDHLPLIVEAEAAGPALIRPLYAG